MIRKFLLNIECFMPTECQVGKCRLSCSDVNHFSRNVSSEVSLLARVQTWWRILKSQDAAPVGGTWGETPAIVVVTCDHESHRFRELHITISSDSRFALILPLSIPSSSHATTDNNNQKLLVNVDLQSQGVMFNSMYQEPTTKFMMPLA